MPVQASRDAGRDAKVCQDSGAVLAIYAIPHNRGIRDPTAREKADAEDPEASGIPAKAFEAGVPSSRVVVIPHANHFVFMSNAADVLREIDSFLRTLP